MAYLLNAQTAELYEEFLSFSRPSVSEQGYQKLGDVARRVLAWFDEEEVELTAVGIEEAVRYQAALSERTKPDGSVLSCGTMRNYLKVARRFFDFLVQTERVQSNPFTELRYPRLSEHLSRNLLSEAQMGRLLHEFAKWDELPTVRARLRRYRVHVIAELLYASGMRIAEAAGLTEEDLDLTHRLVYVRCGKGGKRRTAFLTSYAAEVLTLYLERSRALVLGNYERLHGTTIFGADKDRLAAVVNGELRSVCGALELPVITSHGFRHSLGTHLLRSGSDMRHIQAILGHERLGTTQVYTRVDKEDLKKSLDEYHPRRYAPRQWGGERHEGA